MGRLSVLFLILMLSACAGARTFDSDMRAQLVGQPITVATQKFGTPKGQTVTGDDVVYVWQKRKSESIFGPAVTKGSGYQILGTEADGHGLYWQGVTYARCVIRATTHRNVITKVTFEGAPADCETITGYRDLSLGHGRPR